MAIEKLSLTKIESLSRKLPITAGENGEQREARCRYHHDGGGLFFRVVRPVDKDATEPVCSWVLRYGKKTREWDPKGTLTWAVAAPGAATNAHCKSATAKTNASGLGTLIQVDELTNGPDKAVILSFPFIPVHQYVFSAIGNSRSIIEDHHDHRVLSTNATLLHL